MVPIFLRIISEPDGLKQIPDCHGSQARAKAPECTRKQVRFPFEKEVDKKLTLMKRVPLALGLFFYPYPLSRFFKVRDSRLPTEGWKYKSKGE